MDWFKSITTWVTGLWRGNRVTAVRQYSYQTMLYTFNQVNALPKLAYSIVTDIPTQRVARHLLRIAAEDIVPLVFVNYANHMIQSIGSDYMAENEEDEVWLGVNATIQTSLYLLNTAIWTYNIRKQSEFLIRTVAVTIEARSKLNRVDNSHDMRVCHDEHCTVLRFIQGSMRDVTTYWATEAAISVIDYVPVVGPNIASALSFYNQGRYLLTVALPDVCNRHQVIYLREHSEIALSLGLGYASSTWLVNLMIGKATGIPSSFYSSQVSLLMSIVHMGIALQLTLPKAPKKTTRVLLDPVLFYQNAIGFIFDISLLGLKAKVTRGAKPGHLKDRMRAVPWGAIANMGTLIRKNPVARVFLPPMLHDFNGFISDPIIRSNWPGVQENSIDILNNILSSSKRFSVRIISTVPSASSFAAQLMFGVPRVFTKTVLVLMRDEEVIALVSRWKNAIEALGQSPISEIDDDYVILNDEDVGLGNNTRSEIDDGYVILSNEDVGLDSNPAAVSAEGIHRYQFFENHVPTIAPIESKDEVDELSCNAVM